MKLTAQLLVSVASLYVACAFQAPSTTTATRSASKLYADSSSPASFLDNLPELPDLFGALKPPSIADVLSESTVFEPTPAGLIQQAGRVIAADLALQDPSLLDTNFQWIGPTVDQSLGKTEYLAAGRFFGLRATFPDYDYRPHDFRIDEADSATVRLTCRVTGTMRGELRLRDEVLPPTGKTMRCPPEAVTMEFDTTTGKVTKLCTGFSMDRLVGNTAGCTGVRAAAVIAGNPPSDWEVYPPTVVVQRFVGRPVPQLEEAGSFLAPFPETVMIQLVKGILATNMAAEDPTLLADDFTYCTPSQGPVRKKNYLDKFARQEFEGVSPSFSHFRIDPYDPVRVWVDVLLTAAGFQGPPQAMSFTFDEDGFCERITSGAVMDPSVGNSGGLGGIQGLKYATGQASPGIATRALPQVLGRIRKRALGVFNGVTVDEYVPQRRNMPTKKARSPMAPKAPAAFPIKKETLSSLRTESAVSPKPKPVAPKPKQDMVAKQQEVKQRATAQAAAASAAKQKQQLAAKQRAGAQAAAAAAATELRLQQESQRKQASAQNAKNSLADSRQKEAETKRLAQANEDARRKQEATNKAATKAAKEQQQMKAKQAMQAKENSRIEREQAQQAAVEQKRMDAQAKARKIAAEKQRKLDEQNKLAREKAQRAMVEAEEKRKQVEARKMAQEKTRKEQLEAKRAAAEQKKREIEERKAAQIAAVEAKKRASSQKQKEKAILSSLSSAVPRATIALFGMGGDKSDDLDRKKTDVPFFAKEKNAPRGVPVLSRWSKKKDGTVTGLIRGSGNFADGERVTTSPIVKGKLETGEVVTTGSGSRYFLS